MTSSNTRGCDFRRVEATGLLKLVVLVAVLLAPSIWMLTVIPPLWRDVDAYIQVTQPPGPATILQYSPLYCFAARLPLYLGYAIQSISAGQPLPRPDSFIHPILTDSGVFLLLLVQHAHCEAIRDLIEDHALQTVGDFAVDLDPAVDRPGMHNQAIWLQKFCAFFR